MSIVFVSIISLFGKFTVNAQDYARILVIGNNLQFFYNTYSQFENGVTLNSGTRVKVIFKCDGANGWELRMFSRFDGLIYQGSATGVDDIELDEIQITLNPIDDGGDPNLVYTSPFILQHASAADSEDDTLILIKGEGGTAGSEIQVDFSLNYALPSMVNKAPGFGLFYTEIEFILVDN